MLQQKTIDLIKLVILKYDFIFNKIKAKLIKLPVVSDSIYQDIVNEPEMLKYEEMTARKAYSLIRNHKKYIWNQSEL